MTQEPARAQLRATPLLYQIGPKLYRKVVARETQRSLWIDTALTDLVATDPEGLNDYLLELIAHDIVRVGASNGWCAFLSPARIKAEEESAGTSGDGAVPPGDAGISPHAGTPPKSDLRGVDGPERPER